VVTIVSCPISKPPPTPADPFTSGRAVGSAWQIGFGNIGGIIATYAFLAKDAPKFKPGYSICLAFICLSAASCCIYFVSVVTQNRNRDRTHAVGVSDYDETEKGDMSPNYRYML
jgi:hypothetical protein